jgi:hypothetical protein
LGVPSPVAAALDVFTPQKYENKETGLLGLQMACRRFTFDFSRRKHTAAKQKRNQVSETKGMFIIPFSQPALGREFFL